MMKENRYFTQKCTLQCTKRILFCFTVTITISVLSLMFYPLNITVFNLNNIKYTTINISDARNMTLQNGSFNVLKEEINPSSTNHGHTEIRSQKYKNIKNDTLETKDNQYGKLKTNNAQQEDKLIIGLDLGNKETITTIHNVCINENNAKRNTNILITAHGTSNSTQEVFHGFTVAFLPEKLPQHVYQINHLVYFLDTVPWIMHNLHHFFKDLAVTLYCIIKKVEALENMTNR